MQKTRYNKKNYNELIISIKNAAPDGLSIKGGGVFVHKIKRDAVFVALHKLFRRDAHRRGCVVPCKKGSPKGRQSLCWQLRFS